MTDLGLALFDCQTLGPVPRDVGGLVKELVDVAEHSIADGNLGLDEAWNSGDMEQLRRIAHRLKGGMACVGMLALSAHYRMIEECASVEDRHALEALLPNLGDLSAQSLSALRDWAGTGGEPHRR